MEVAPGIIQIWSDLGCPWAHLTVWRLWNVRRRLGLERRVRFDHRVFPLELFNSEPTPFATVAAEIPVCAGLEPRAGWQPWAAEPGSWPVTMLPPMEAVQAAKEQGLAASEALDRGLRHAFFAESRCISLRHVILEVASETDALDVDGLAAALDDGAARRRIFDDWALAKTDAVRGSPHLFLPDGSSHPHPATHYHWEGGEEGSGAPLVDRDEPEILDELVRRAAG